MSGRVFAVLVVLVGCGSSGVPPGPGPQPDPTLRVEVVPCFGYEDGAVSRDRIDVALVARTPSPTPPQIEATKATCFILTALTEYPFHDRSSEAEWSAVGDGALEFVDTGRAIPRSVGAVVVQAHLEDGRFAQLEVEVIPAIELLSLDLVASGRCFDCERVFVGEGLRLRVSGETLSGHRIYYVDQFDGFVVGPADFEVRRAPRGIDILATGLGTIEVFVSHGELVAAFTIEVVPQSPVRTLRIEGLPPTIALEETVSVSVVASHENGVSREVGPESEVRIAPPGNWVLNGNRIVGKALGLHEVDAFYEGLTTEAVPVEIVESRQTME